MKKSVLVLLAAAVALSLVPATAATSKSKTLTFDAAVPCAAAACSYWLPHQESPGTFGVLPWLAGTSLDGTPAEGLAELPLEEDEDAAYDKQTAYGCTAPLVAETFTDHVLTVPSKAKSVKITYTPGIDWDVYICAKPKVGNNGRMLAFESVNASGCADYVETINFGSIGCPSTVMSKVKPGTKIVVRGYNFADVDTLSAKLRWIY